MFDNIKNAVKGRVEEAQLAEDTRAVSVNNMITTVVGIAIGATVVASVGITAVDSLSNISTTGYSAGVAGMIELLPILVVVAFVFLFLGAAGLRNRR